MAIILDDNRSNNSSNRRNEVNIRERLEEVNNYIELLEQNTAKEGDDNIIYSLEHRLYFTVGTVISRVPETQLNKFMAYISHRIINRVPMQKMLTLDNIQSWYLDTREEKDIVDLLGDICFLYSFRHPNSYNILADRMRKIVEMTNKPHEESQISALLISHPWMFGLLMCVFLFRLNFKYCVLLCCLSESTSSE